MKNNRIFLIPIVLSIPFIYLILTGSKETIFLGFISLALLTLFLYTLRLMSGTEKISIRSQEQNINSNSFQEQENEFQEEESFNLPIEAKEKINYQALSFFEKPTKLDNIIPINLGIREIRKSRFKKETLGPMVKSFVQELPLRIKTVSLLFCIYENSLFKEFLMQRGSLFIDCDTDAVLEAEDNVWESLLQNESVLSEDGRNLYVCIATPTKILGMVSLESISGFLPNEKRLIELECEKFALDWEARTDYELAILDPKTLVYNKNHFNTILREKFFTREEEFSLFAIEVSDSKNREEFISYLAENLPFSIYRMDESKLGFFLSSTEIDKLSEQLDAIVQSLDEQGFFVEFYVAYSPKSRKLESALEWEEDINQQLLIAKRKNIEKQRQVANG
ncbi:MAG: hypothetical protein MH321_17040 [Leptospiraceae bacterium]|nr:hypothetical protein [Leptospiraceae bacterium]